MNSENTSSSSQPHNFESHKKVPLHVKSCVVFGATSAIAQAVATIHARQGYQLVLIGRKQEKLDQIAAHLQVQGASRVTTHVQDLNQFDQHQILIDKIQEDVGRFDRILIAQGTLPEQTDIQTTYEKTFQCIQDNALSTISLATILGNIMEQQESGNLAIISSVAGDRGRQSNYIYGACKAMVTTFAAGLRNRLTPKGAHVITIKPGFVDTPMTASFSKSALWAQPEDVAKDITKAYEKRSNTIYTPWFWRYIMLIIQHVPEVIFKKLKL